MPVIGVTGGVATGKSTVARGLGDALRHAGFPVMDFSADECAQRLRDTDPGVQEAIRGQFGADYFQADGRLDRERLRETVFRDPARRRCLEDILHPVIRAEWMGLASDFRGVGKYFVAEIPLLYETKAEGWFDQVILVGASRGRQMERLIETRSWAAETACRAMDAQQPLMGKIPFADMLIWNDHSKDLLIRQIHAAAHSLRNFYV